MKKVTNETGNHQFVGVHSFYSGVTFHDEIGQPALDTLAEIPGIQVEDFDLELAGDQGQVPLLEEDSTEEGEEEQSAPTEEESPEAEKPRPVLGKPTRKG